MGRLDLDAETWARLSELLDQALDLPPAQRTSWLEALDAGHDALKPRLRELLSRAASVETGFLGELPRLDDPAAPPAVEAGEGGHVGPYRLLRELGSGGMGSVWLAERADGLINRPVALKFPRGLWIREGLRERMAREREILASLEHPGIARLYDAGLTESGDPYLALEYVEGLTLDAYCAAAQLGVRARLDLFLQVADAVAYAHSKLIVHRDLKPANILVTQSGEARLLDFGIGKLLDEQQARDAWLTELAGRALTPDYASPEQITGEPLTVATDVYSLGVILYELLTGQRPYRPKRDSRGALEDAIVEAEPQRPSQVVTRAALRKQLRGDLDAIT
ncbi:MAG: protein kinase, partial [Gammaproteobacteria bacterium]|nr:protein kinase [Gammaproteobacteria bacterium]